MAQICCRIKVVHISPPGIGFSICLLLHQDNLATYSKATGHTRQLLEPIALAYWNIFRIEYGS